LGFGWGRSRVLILIEFLRMSMKRGIFPEFVGRLYEGQNQRKEVGKARAKKKHKYSSTRVETTEQREGEKKMEKIKKFLKEEDGVTAIEYTLIAAVIALGIVAAVGLVQGWITTRLTEVSGIATN
jgi:pilus assembly protein Flp/PilA